jgi:hypothetical protein
VPDEHAGKRVRCPGCGTVSDIPLPQAAVSEPIPEAIPEAPEAEGYQLGEPIDQPQPQERRKRPKSRSKPKKKRGFFSDMDTTPESGMSNAGVILGVLMMVGAVVWFVLGIFAGWVFYYPPILFIVGIVAVVKGIARGKL